MSSFQSQIGAARLYPSCEPFAQHMMSVGNDHTLYVEQCGNPKGIPVVVLHGGPGGGCSPMMRRFFNPDLFHIILFDQRGCGRSTPHASVDHNTTWDLVADIEQIRDHLGIETWIVFGGSWGATLSLAYAQSHPERVAELVLRGVFMMTQAELDWFYGGGAGRFFPEKWAQFRDMVPPSEQDDLIAAYHKRLFDSDERTQAKFAGMWSHWETSLATLDAPKHTAPAPSKFARAFARLENHYFMNKGFMEEGQLFTNMPRIAHIKGTIVQGRYDMICPPHTAYALKQAWDTATLHLIPNAGHSLSELAIAQALVATMDQIGAKNS